MGMCWPKETLPSHVPRQTLDQWLAANKDRIPLGGAG
jgi:hypothetical protein